ncbi:MAG: DNA polymerase III [Spirochaetaceae bacterium]|jgi:DNA polymerase-3 subunit gamma/tau|nr:DNA polymerase III [Spirochaetaceae bacterium]
MFENIIAQDAAAQIAFDIERRAIPPSILFQGPPLSGKGASALEAARVFSCSAEDAPWGCGCEHCARHRLLSHPDLLVTGRRPFLPEINAAKEAFFRESLPTTKTLFVRAVKKLLLRFSAVLAEGDTRLSKINGPLENINGDLEEWAAEALQTEKSEKEAESFLKLTCAIIKNAVKLDAEGITDTIPVSHIRAASYWLHTAPAGNKKALIIENAERMQDAARNSLLKTLEEPPKDAVIILTSAHPKMLLATILSRVRPYTFVQRSARREADVLRRVFREKTIAESAGSPLSDYFERCSGVSQKSLGASAALWVASAAAAAVLVLKKTHGVLPPELVALGKYAAPIAEKAEYGRPNTNLKTLLETIMEKTAGFAERETFARFLEETLSVIRGALFTQEITPLAIRYTETGKAHVRTAQTAVETYNQGKAIALERLFLSLSDSFARTV